MQKKPLSDSLLWTIASIIIGIIVVVYPMIWSVKLFLIFILVGSIVHLIFRSPWTIKIWWPLKAVISLVAVFLLAFVSWNPIKEQWAKEHPIKQAEQKLSAPLLLSEPNDVKKKTTKTKIIAPRDEAPKPNQEQPKKAEKDGDIIVKDSPGSIVTKNQQGNNYIGETYPMEKWTFEGTKKIWKTPMDLDWSPSIKFKEFDEMINLEKERKYPDLISLCKKQIAETPKWITPYLFLGIAQANIKLKEEAIVNLKYVVKNVSTTLDPDNPNYQSATRILKLLEQ